MADHVDHGLPIEAGFRSQNQRLDDGDPANLGEHVVDQFHHEPLPNRAKVDDLRSHGLENGLRSLDKAASADKDFFSLRGGVDHRDDPLCARGDIGRAGRELCTERGDALAFLAIDVVGHERVPGLQNVRGNRAPHHSEADKSDGVFSGVTAQDTLPPLERRLVSHRDGANLRRRLGCR